MLRTRTVFANRINLEFTQCYKCPGWQHNRISMKQGLTKAVRPSLLFLFGGLLGAQTGVHLVQIKDLPDLLVELGILCLQTG